MNLFIKNRAKDFQNVFGTEEGRRVLGDLINFCGADNQIFVPNDPHSTSFNAGKHRVMQHIQSILNYKNEEMLQLNTNFKQQKLRSQLDDRRSN
jgi:hypothetical protein